MDGSDEDFNKLKYLTIKQQFRPQTSAKKHMDKEKERRKKKIEQQKKELLSLNQQIEKNELKKQEQFLK